MALYLVRATPGAGNQRNSSQVNGYIVDAADEASARAAATAAVPSGESKPKPTWQAVLLSSMMLPLLVVGRITSPAAGER